MAKGVRRDPEAAPVAPRCGLMRYVHDVNPKLNTWGTEEMTAKTCRNGHRSAKHKARERLLIATDFFNPSLVLEEIDRALSEHFKATPRVFQHGSYYRDDRRYFGIRLFVQSLVSDITGTRGTLSDRRKAREDLLRWYCEAFCAIEHVPDEYAKPPKATDQRGKRRPGYEEGDESTWSTTGERKRTGVGRHPDATELLRMLESEVEGGHPEGQENADSTDEAEPNIEGEGITTETIDADRNDSADSGDAGTTEQVA